MTPEHLHTSGHVGPWLQRNAASLRQLLQRAGAVVVRGLDIGGPRALEAALSATFSLTSYLRHSTPRTVVDGRVLTSTDVDGSATIPLHSECAYSWSPPGLVVFWCETPSPSGGQTTLASLDDVTTRLPRELVERWSRRGLRYHQHLRPHLGQSWQAHFQTEEPHRALQLCDELGLRGTFLGPDHLHLQWEGPVTVRGRWFNQAHAFHPSSLGDWVESTLRSIVGNALPRDVEHADGTQLSRADLAAIRVALGASSTPFRWRTGDLMFIDNLRVAHGRTPYSGPRQLRVVLASPWTSASPGAIPSPFSAVR